jgi:hypothetical protein
MSLSNHPDVLQVVNGKTFVQSVRLSCEILKDSTSLTDDVIRRAALTQAYPRIALILSTSVDKDKASILPPGGISYEILYREVERLATSQPYVDDIHRVAAALTASYFIRATPLNSSIQLLPLGDRMEQQAIEDLDRLRGQVLQQIKSLLGDGDAVAAALIAQEGPTFYFSGLIEDGRSSDQILIPEGTKGVAVYTLTSTQPVPLEIAIEVPLDLPSLITNLSEAINQLSVRGGSNILASPNRGVYTIAPVDCVQGGALVRLDYITLSPRRSDPIVTKELAILCFYLIPDSVPVSSWKGSVLETSIPSILYGVVPNYKNLHPSGPHSILLQVEKSAITKVNTNNTVDTIYLQGSGDGVVKYAISIDGLPYDGVVPVSAGTGSSGTVTQVAESLREVLGANALVAQVNPQAIQVIPTGASTISVGITSVPVGVTTSMGTATSSLYPYGSGPVAVTINPNSGRSIRRPTLAEEATGVYSATNFKIQVSPRMQAVYDQMGRMDRLRRGQGGHCRH